MGPVRGAICRLNLATGARGLPGFGTRRLRAFGRVFFRALSTDPGFGYVLVDATICKTHADATSQKGGLDAAGIGRSKGGLTIARQHMLACVRVDENTGGRRCPRVADLSRHHPWPVGGSPAGAGPDRGADRGPARDQGCGPMMQITCGPSGPMTCEQPPKSSKNRHAAPAIQSTGSCARNAIWSRVSCIGSSGCGASPSGAKRP